jgi:hypothetical protein
LVVLDFVASAGGAGPSRVKKCNGVCPVYRIVSFHARY